MSEQVRRDRAKPMISYVFRTARKGEPVFFDTTLPDGTIVRMVDKEVHDRALKRVADKYRDHAE